MTTNPYNGGTPRPGAGTSPLDYMAPLRRVAPADLSAWEAERDLCADLMTDARRRGDHEEADRWRLLAEDLDDDIRGARGMLYSNHPRVQE